MLFVSCFHLTMIGSSGDSNQLPPHSARTKGIIQHFERQVKLDTDALNEDVCVTNERLGQLEMAQIATNVKLTTLEASVVTVNTNITEILRCFDEMGRVRPDKNGAHNGLLVTKLEENKYSTDTEIDDTGH